MSEVMQANISYLKTLRDRLNGNTPDINAYKLSRKGVYVNLANLAAAFTAMQTEPGRKAINEDNVYRFQVLSYNLSSVITSLFSSAKQSVAQQQYTGQILLIDQSIELMQEASAGLNSSGNPMPPPSPGNSEDLTITSASGAQLLYSLSRQLVVVINA
jgi:hypothetical protein